MNDRGDHGGRRWWRVTGAAVVLVLLLTACGGPSSSTEDGDGASGDGASGGPSGTLRYGAEFVLDNWNTLNKPNTTYTSLPYEQLVALAADGVTLEPRLATEWEQTDTEVKFTLRDDVVFHDGEPFNAEAVKTFIEWLQTTPSQYQPTVDMISEVVVEDDTHVTFKLERPAPTLLPNLARRGGYVISPKALAEDTYEQMPAGTGPWVFDPDESVEGSKVVMTYFQDYYAPEEVGPERIEVWAITDNDARINALATGQVDVISMPAALAGRAESQGFEVNGYSALRYHLLMYDRKDLFADKRVRQAICHALDLDAINEATFNGLGTPRTQRFLEGQPGYNPDVTGYEHDVERAKQLMAEAGNPEISITFPVFGTTRPIGEVLASQLAEIGIQVEVANLTTPEYFSTFDTGKYPLAYNTSQTEDTGPWDYYIFRFAPDGTGNPFHVADPVLDDLAQRALNETDPDAQEQLWQQMTQRIHDEALDCGFIDYAQAQAWASDRVDNIVPTQMVPSTFRYKEAQVLG